MRISDWSSDVCSSDLAVRGRHIVVGHRQRRLGMAQLAAGEAKSFEGLGRSHLVHEVTVDVDEAGAVVLTVDHMTVPDLVKQGARRGHLSRSLQAIVLLQQSGPEDSALPGRLKGVQTGGRNRIRADRKSVG